MNPAVHSVDVVRVGPESGAAARDVAAAEEPLEIRLGGQPFVVIMRTPGTDRELVAGFLLSEQIVRQGSDIASMRYCKDGERDSGLETRDSADPESRIANPESGVPDPGSPIPDPETSNVMNIWLAGEAVSRAAVALAGRRHVTANSACGVCGRRSIDDLMEGTRRVESAATVSRSTVAAMSDVLRAAQKTFDETGGLHAAGLFDLGGTLTVVAEDVGRHNAVDKVIGAELLEGRVPLPDRILFVSGRTSFEIVQKAVVAGVPIVASVSAPSSLAIELAREANLTLLGFVRGQTFNIYAGAERVAL